MNTPGDRKKALLAMKAEIMERLQSAQADLDAVDRLLTLQQDIDPVQASATVEEIRCVAFQLLTQHESPVHRQTLLEEIENMGIHVSGKVPVNNLGSILSRFSKDFEPHGHGIWGLKSQSNPLPSAETIDSIGHNGWSPTE